MLNKLKEILTEVDDIYLRKKIDEIKISDKLIDDLGVDSLGRVAIFHEISFELNLELEESVCAKWSTIEDIINTMQGHS